MTVIQELDRFMQEITANAPEEQAKQLHALMANTKETFSSDLAEVSDQVEAVKSSRGMLSSMKTCLRNMKDAMAGIESLTLTVCDLGMEHYMREYKQRRAELSDALSRLEAVQSELERFLELYRDCEGSIAELNGALRDPVEDSNEMERLRVQAEQVQLKILDMERMVESLENQNIRSGQRNQLIIIQESYAKLISALSAAYSSSHNGSLTPSPRVKSPHRSPRHRHASDTGTPRQTLRHWLRSKTDELQELMSRPFPFDDKSIQSMWHNIQKYQGDLVVRGEEFSLYATDTDGDQPAMDQITPLIDTCSDLSYRLDSHARLCVQYTADQSQLAALAERQQRIDKLLSKKGTAIGLLPIPDDEQLEQTLAESRNTAEKTRRKLQQHESNLTTLQETVERFDTRCDEAKDSLKSAESLLHQASGRGAEKEVLKETIETVTTECKTRLHECVTYIEQAEIAVTEMEQGSSGAGKMSPHKETIKEIQAKHSALSSQLREVETKAAMTAEQQKSLQTLAHKVDDWLEGAEQAVANKVGLDSGLDDMRDHIIKLHELEKSMDGTSGWLTEMKKLCRSLNQGAAAERQEENSQIVGSRDERFEKLGGNLKERTDALSREMEVVIGWIQKNSDLSKQLNDTKYQLTEISSKETNPESISWKLETLQGSIESVQRLLKEYNDLVSCTPPSVSERQRTSATNGQQSCEALLRELNGMHRNLSEVVKIWTDFAQLSGEVKGHLRHCESQLNAVNLPGVSLDARQQRYQEMVEALEKYPDGTSPVYLQEMLSTCSVPSPGLYSEAISLMDDHEKLLSTAKKGAKEFGEQVRVRAEVEQRLKADTFALKEMSDQLQSAAQLDDWSKGSCDSVLRLIQTQETELKALAEKTSSLINAQKQQHASDEETMTLDLKESIDDYGDMEREMTAQLVQEKEVMGLAKEFCQYLSEGVTAVEDWLTRSKDLEEEVKSGRAPAETVEQRLKLCQGEAEEMKKHLQRGRGYAEQIGTSLTNSAQRRLAEQLSNLSGDMIARETELAKLVEEKGQLGRTKALQNEQLQEVEETMKGMVSQVHAVANSTTRSMQDCEDKLKQIEALECQRPEVQSGLDQLYETSKLLTSFMKNGQPAEHEKVVGQLCGEKWNALKAKLQQVGLA
ncbi:myosin-2 heavy chain-like [Watersipora subatra]|uniref:myosin-2 heavy chain-like n=1 Tax=Watersipora subatra TaxID=2589382 RepID=UPI00355BF935